MVVRAGACPFGSFFSRVAGARPGATGAADADTTLLARLGGNAALLAAVDLFYGAVPKDDKVARFFARTDMARLKEHQARPLHLRRRGGAACRADLRAIRGARRAASETCAFGAQVKFMTQAFTSFPDGYDVAAYMTKGHARLVRDGLDETHFDVIAGHLAGALAAAGEPPELVAEAVGVVAPLRDVFKRNAEEFRAQQAQAGAA